MTNSPTKSRPAMKNYGISTKQDGMLEWDWVDAQMAKSRNYWIGSTKADGRPHVAPVWGVWVDGTLYFSSDPDSQKARNLRANPEVVVHLESGDDTVIIEGTAALGTPGKSVSDAYSAKYGPGIVDENTKYYALKPRKVLAWREQDFPNSATRWEF
jgi:hypothetical protein